MHKHEVYVPYQKGSKYNRFINSENINVNIIDSACFNKLDRRIWPIKMFKIWRDFKKIRKEKRIDLIHAHSLVVNGLIAYLNYKKNGTPYIVTVRNTDANKFLLRTPLFSKLIKPILINADRILFLSPAYWENNFKLVYDIKFINKITNKVDIVPNGIDKYWYKNELIKKNEHNSLFRVLFVGDLTPNKNVEKLILACEKLEESGVNVVLDVVGDGSEKVRLTGMDVNFTIYFHGKIKQKDKLKELYQKASVLAVISRTESFGLVYAEALSQGTPILYTKGQGFDGFFKDGEVGYPVNSINNIDEISKKLLLIKENYSLIINNIYNLKPKFKWDKISQELSNIYNSIILNK